MRPTAQALLDREQESARLYGLSEPRDINAFALGSLAALLADILDAKDDAARAFAIDFARRGLNQDASQ